MCEICVHGSNLDNVAGHFYAEPGSFLGSLLRAYAQCLGRSFNFIALLCDRIVNGQLAFDEMRLKQGRFGGRKVDGSQQRSAWPN